MTTLTLAAQLWNGINCPLSRPTLCGIGLPSWSVLVNLRSPPDIEALPSNPMFGSS